MEKASAQAAPVAVAEQMTAAGGRIAGAMLAVLGAAIAGANFGLAYLLGIYLPIIMLPAGPMIALGLGNIVHPGVAASWVDPEATETNPWGGSVVLRVFGAALLAVGILIAIRLFTAMHS